MNAQHTPAEFLDGSGKLVPVRVVQEIKRLVSHQNLITQQIELEFQRAKVASDRIRRELEEDIARLNTDSETRITILLKEQEQIVKRRNRLTAILSTLQQAPVHDGSNGDSPGAGLVNGEFGGGNFHMPEQTTKESSVSTQVVPSLRQAKMVMDGEEEF